MTSRPATKAELLAENAALRKKLASAAREKARLKRLEARISELESAVDARTHELAEASEQQTATAEILRVISNSPIDVQPVMDAVAEHAARLCGAADGAVWRVEEGLLRRVASYGLLPRPPSAEIPLSRGFVTGRAVVDREIVHVRDLAAEGDEFAQVKARQGQTGARTMLGVPLLREGSALGAIVIRRREARPFTDKQIALVKTFTDQAVIAIENVRLFKELEARNRAVTEAHAQVTEALEQQTATTEILRVISSSPTDLRPVLEAVVERAARLCEADDVNIHLVDGEILRLAAKRGPIPTEETRPITPTRIVGRAVLDRQTIHVHDRETRSVEFPDAPAGLGVRTSLATPLLREGVPIGVISIRRLDVRPFSQKQITLLKTFADQAVIAIENVRLFTELNEALGQQTATSEVLDVISRSALDVTPVFQAVVDKAVELCGADNASILRRDGEMYRYVANAGDFVDEKTFMSYWGPVALSAGRGSLSGRVALERRSVQIDDIDTDPEYEPQYLAQKVPGTKTHLAVPLLKDGEPVGLIIARRFAVRPFTEKQIKLLETFAAQAVIAIENVRLFKELQARNRDLTEALEQQTATSEILRAISGSPTDLQPVFDTIVRNAGRVCDAVDALLVLREGKDVRAAAHWGPIRTLTTGARYPLSRGTAMGRAILEARSVHVENIATASDFPEGRDLATQFGHRTALAVPLLRQDEPVGSLLIRRTEVCPFSDKQIAMLQSFADQAVIAIENVRLFKELEARNRDLTEALEQQTATGEILRVISSSPTDLQPVLRAIVASAVRLTGASSSFLHRFDGTTISVEAFHPDSAETRAAWEDVYPAPATRGTPTGRALLDRTVVHLTDTERDLPALELSAPAATRAGNRSVLVVPMLREGRALGTIVVARPEVGGFSDKQIELLKTFADQAVLAIENVRLFNELHARTAELTRSVEQLTALGEVGRAVSSTLDLEAVLSSVVSRASQLVGADTCSVYEYDEEAAAFVLRATHNIDEKVAALARSRPIRKGEGVAGRMAETREPVQVPDITAEGAYQGPLRDVLLRSGARALLAIPLLREDQLIGGLTVTRKSPGEFPPEAVDVLKTFATQSAVAMQNARLFRELEAKSRQLEIASRHKSDFLANVSHELRTPMNAMLGFNEMILGEVYGEVPHELKVPLTDIQDSGKHLLRLINNVLDLSKIEAGLMELALGEYFAQDTVATVGTSLRSLAIEKGLDFVISAPEDIPPARGDAGRITQCLMNLAGNALKFTRQGRVEIAVELRGDVLHYRVADTGIGIARDQLETVFSEFRQGDPTIASEFGGTGLGLSITRKFVELHGGRIWLESELGKGSTFHFAIPLRVELAKTA